MYDKKCYEMSCGDFRRDYPHFGNGFNSQYCANYGNLEQSGHSEDAAMNSIAWYAPSNCPVGNLSPQSVSCGHHGASHSSHLGSSVTGHPCRHSSSFPQHGHCSYPHAPDHDSLSVVQSGLVSGGNVNELSATSTEHVINRCDLYANRALEYGDCAYSEPNVSQMEHRTIDSFAYNQEEEYICCTNLEDPHSLSWFEAESCRTWESNSPNRETVLPTKPSAPNHQHSSLLMTFENRPKTFDAMPYIMDNATVARYELDKFQLARPAACGSFPTGQGLMCPSPSYIPFKDYKTIGPSAVSLNGAVNRARAHPLVDSKPAAMSSIQMRTHSTKYKLMSQLGEHITIKEHNYTDVYRIKKEGSDFCKAKTLYSQHILIDRVDQSSDKYDVSNMGSTSSSNSSCSSTHSPCQTISLHLESKANLCFICGKTYARPSTLKTHLRTHSGEKPFKCHFCSKSFSQAANLTAHIRTHSGEKPFPCPVCKRRFSQSSSVTTHLRTHSGERPYTCQFCQHSFSDSSTLTKHLRIHSGEKPYQCHVCFIRFSQSGNLNRHMRIHSIQETSKN